MKSCSHLLVIVLLTEDLTLGSDFCEWLKDLATVALKNRDDKIGILPVALSSTAEKLSIDNFTEFELLRIADLGEPALRAGYLGLLALQNAWCLLENGSNEKLRLFISHAKIDGSPIALALKSQIESLPFLQRFYDAQDILPGTRWRKVLENGVKKSVLVVLRTDVYERRAWCVQELEWGEEYGCPAIIIDVRSALAMPRESLQVSGMATMKIGDGNLVRVLNGALREALRVQLFRHSVRLLEELRALPKNRTALLVRSSLSSLGIVCEKNKRIWEIDSKPNNTIKAVVTAEPFRESIRPAAEKLVQAYFKNAQLGTLRDFAEKASLTRQLNCRPLQKPTQKEDWIIGISISYADELSQIGYNPEDVKRATIRLCESLLSAGARLVFGHDWRPDGVMDAICRIAVKYQQPIEGKNSPKPLIQSLVTWPHEPSLDSEFLRDLEQRGVLKVETVRLPSDSDWSRPNDPIARAIALTAMRREMTTRTNARVCLGGKEKSVEGFFAGIVEEAYSATVANHPLFIGSFLGGAAKQLALFLKGRITKPKCLERIRRDETEEQFIKLMKSKFARDRAYEPDDLSSVFSNEKLQSQSGLTPNDWENLITCDDVVGFSTLVIRGLRQSNPALVASNEKKPISSNQVRKR